MNNRTQGPAAGINGNTKPDPKTDLRTSFDRLSPTNLAANQAIVDALKKIGERRTSRCRAAA